MAQSAIYKTTFSAIAGHAAFERGVQDFLHGNPFPPEYDRLLGLFGKRGAQWHYERGRLFAASCRGRDVIVPAQRVGRKVSVARISLLSWTFRKGDLT